MAKLIFVTGPTASGKTQYTNRDRGRKSFVIHEVSGDDSWGYSLSEIHRRLAEGLDVYVEWILPEGTEIQWVPLGQE